MRINELAFYLCVLIYFCPSVCFGFGTGRRRQANWKYDDTCSRDCSQTEPRIFGDTTVFNCTIGNLSEAKKFRENYKKKMEAAEIRFDPPKLLGIDFYHKYFEDDGLMEGALNITFQLPKGKRDGYHEMEYPLAVFLHFQSVQDPAYRDPFYYNNSRERIFQFLNYKPKMLFDSQNPRNISYDCLVGLDDSKPVRAYKITLETAFGRSITYYCTVYTQQGWDAGYKIKWRPTIATSLNLLDRSVHVVFEEYTLDVKPGRELYYNVSLVKMDKAETVVDYKKINTGKHEAVLTNLKHGKYFVRVSKCEEIFYEGLEDYDDNSPSCISASSYEIDATGIPDENIDEFSLTESPITYTAGHDALHLALAVGIGCLTGIIVVALLIYVVLRARKKDASHSSSSDGSMKPTGLILHTHTANQQVLEKFSLYLQAICDCFIHIDILEKDKEKLKNPEKWFSHVLKSASFVIVVCTGDTEGEKTRIPETQSNNFYRWAIDQAISRKKSSNDIRIIYVKFSTVQNDAEPGITNKEYLTLMQDMLKLYNFIHPYKTLKTVVKVIDADTYHMHSEAGKDLKQALDRAKQVASYNKKSECQLQMYDENKLETEIEKKQSDSKETQIKDNLKSESEYKSVRPDGMDVIAGFNDETSSSDEEEQTHSKNPEHRPLLYSAQGFDIIETGIRRNESYNRTRSQSFHKEQDDTNSQDSFHYPNTRTVEDNQTLTHSLPPDVEMNKAHYCLYHKPHNEPHVCYNQNNVSPSKSMQRSDHLTAYYHGTDVSRLSDVRSVVLPRDSHLCQINENIGYFQLPEFEAERDYNYDVCFHSEEYKNPDIAARTCHSFPQEMYRHYRNRNLHHQYMPGHLHSRLEFQAVDPPEREIVDSGVVSGNRRDRDRQIDSGYSSGMIRNVSVTEEPGRPQEDDLMNFGAIFNEEVVYQRKDQAPTLEYLQENDENKNSMLSDENRRSGGLSISARYSYPLSLSKKHDFNSDMFIPPDDLESCLSDKDGSSDEIMDQLASINVRIM